MFRSARRFGACVAPPRIEKTGRDDARGFVRALARCVWLRVRGICVCVCKSVFSLYPKKTKKFGTVFPIVVEGISIAPPS